MSDENKVEEVTEVQEETNASEQETQEAPEQELSSDGDIEKLVEERLAKMKTNMDRMAKERDEALKAKAEIEKAKKDAEMERLRDEGKIQEALEMELSELKAKLSLYEEENVKLNRDRVLSDNLSGLEFRNDRSREMAYRDIVEQLIQNDQGAWVHKSGTSIKDFVESYSKSEDNSFLFRPKPNSGSGATNTTGNPSVAQEKSILEMNTNELLDFARKGKLGNYQL